MLIHATRPLFAWAELEDAPWSPSAPSWGASPTRPCSTASSGRGRDDYPVRVLSRHVWLNDCLAEPHRNPALSALLGIRRVVDIPKPHDLSRFLDALGEPAHLQRLLIDVRQHRLGELDLAGRRQPGRRVERVLAGREATRRVAGRAGGRHRASALCRPTPVGDDAPCR